MMITAIAAAAAAAAISLVVGYAVSLFLWFCSMSLVAESLFADAAYSLVRHSSSPFCDESTWLFPTITTLNFGDGIVRHDQSGGTCRGGGRGMMLMMDPMDIDDYHDDHNSNNQYHHGGDSSDDDDNNKNNSQSQHHSAHGDGQAASAHVFACFLSCCSLLVLCLLKRTTWSMLC